MAERLIQLSDKIKNNNLWDGNPDRAVRIVEKFFWKTKAGLLDQELVRISNLSAKEKTDT